MAQAWQQKWVMVPGIGSYLGLAKDALRNTLVTTGAYGFSLGSEGGLELWPCLGINRFLKIELRFHKPSPDLCSLSRRKI